MYYNRQLLTFPPTKRRLYANVQPKALRQGQAPADFTTTRGVPFRPFAVPKKALPRETNSLCS